MNKPVGQLGPASRPAFRRQRRCTGSHNVGIGRGPIDHLRQDLPATRREVPRGIRVALVEGEQRTVPAQREVVVEVSEPRLDLRVGLGRGDSQRGSSSICQPDAVCGLRLGKIENVVARLKPRARRRLLHALVRLVEDAHGREVGGRPSRDRRLARSIEVRDRSPELATVRGDTGVVGADLAVDRADLAVIAVDRSANLRVVLPGCAVVLVDRPVDHAPVLGGGNSSSHEPNPFQMSRAGPPSIRKSQRLDIVGRMGPARTSVRYNVRRGVGLRKALTRCRESCGRGTPCSSGRLARWPSDATLTVAQYSGMSPETAPTRRPGSRSSTSPEVP